MFNKMMYLCARYKFSWRTFWAAREILDSLIVDFNIINKFNILMYTMIALWMASKYHEANPLIIMKMIKQKKIINFTKFQVLEG